MLNVDTMQDTINPVQAMNKPCIIVVINADADDIIIMGAITSSKNFIIGRSIFSLRKEIRQTRANAFSPILIINTQTGLKPANKKSNDKGKLANTKQLPIT